MAKGHTTKERRLLDDIRSKNHLRNRLDKLQLRHAKWESDVEYCTKKSQKKRLQQSLNRYWKQIEDLKGEIVICDKDLIVRIQKEMKSSEKEVADFRDQYKKEYDEYLKAQAEISKTEKKKESARTKDVLARLRRKAKKEKKDIADVGKELDSEAKDKIVLAIELKRATAELATYES